MISISMRRRGVIEQDSDDDELNVVPDTAQGDGDDDAGSDDDHKNDTDYGEGQRRSLTNNVAKSGR